MNKSTIIAYIVNFTLLTMIYAVCFISISFYKDVPVYEQHLFGHDLNAYKIFEYIMLSIGCITGYFLSWLILHSENK